VIDDVFALNNRAQDATGTNVVVAAHVVCHPFFCFALPIPFEPDNRRHADKEKPPDRTNGPFL
jgi:hypothetical protein